jgi:hypothetical protein
MDDRRPTALRARPPRGAPRPRARVLRLPVVGRVVVAMRDSGDELDTPSPRDAGRVGSCLSRDGNRQRTSGAMRQRWLAGRSRDLLGGLLKLTPGYGD